MSLHLFSGAIAATDLPTLITNILGITLGLIFSFTAALWLGLLIWAGQDISARTNSIVLRILALLPPIIFPLGGILIYLAIRPHQRLADIAQRQLEEESLREDLSAAIHCGNCHARLKDDYLVCPACGQQLKQTCPHCERLLEMDWAFCSYCGSSLGTEEFGDVDASEHIEKFAEIAGIGTIEPFSIIEKSMTSKALNDTEAETVDDDFKAEEANEDLKESKASEASEKRAEKKLEQTQSSGDRSLEISVGG